MSNFPFQAASRTPQSIRKIACLTREMLGYEPGEPMRMDRLLEHRLPKVLPTFVFAVLPKEIMGDNHGIAQPDIDYIALRSDVYAGTARNSGQDRFTAAHELGHLFLHQQRNIVLARTIGRGPRDSDPEWQANTFAAELLMHHEACRGITDVDWMCRRFKVSRAAADIRIRDLAREALLRKEKASTDWNQARSRNPTVMEWRT